MSAIPLVTKQVPGPPGPLAATVPIPASLGNLAPGSPYPDMTWAAVSCPPWAADTTYVAGSSWPSVVTPGNGYYYTCTVAGVSGASAPAWPTSAGTVQDGGVTWAFGGALVDDETTWQLSQKSTASPGAGVVAASAAAGGGNWLLRGVSGTITGTAPITVTGVAAPVVAISPATDSAAGSMSAADKAKIDGLALSVANPAALTALAPTVAYPTGTTLAYVQSTKSTWQLDTGSTLTPDGVTVVAASAAAGGGNWILLQGGQYGSFSSPVDSSTLARSSIVDFSWQQLGWYVPIACDDEAFGGYLDGCLVNAYANAPTNARLGQIVCVPPGTGGLTLTRTMRTAASLGNPAATVVLAIYDVTGTTPLASKVCALTAVETAYSVTYAAASPGTEYQVQVVINATSVGSSAQAQYEDLGGSVTSTGASGILAQAFGRLHVTPAAMLDNLEPPNRADTRGNVYSALSRLVVDTTAPEMLVEFWSPIWSAPNQSNAYMTVLVNGRETVVIAPASSAVQFAHVQIGAGRKRVEIVTGGTAPPESALNGTFPRAIYVPAGSELTLSSTDPGRRLVVDGDSISIGNGSTNNSLRGWVRRIRRSIPNAAAPGYSGRQLVDDYTTTASAATRAKFLARYRPDDVILDLGTNDWGNAACTSTNFGTYTGQALDALHAAMPAARIWALTPIQRVGETTPNSNGEKLSAFRTQMASAVSSRTAFAGLIPGPDILTQAYLADGLHPNDLGHDITQRYVAGALGFGAPQISAWVDPIAGSLVDLWEAASGIALDGSSNVQTWTGLQGTALAQATGSARPGYTLYGQNGLPAVLFTGSQFLQIAQALFPNRPWTIAIVCMTTTVTGTTITFSMGNANGVYLAYASGQRNIGYPGSAVLVDSTSVAANTYETWIVTNDGTTTTLYIDGVAQTLTNSTSQPTAPTALTQIGDFNGTFFFQGQLQFAGIWSAVVSVATLSAALEARFGT